MYVYMRFTYMFTMRFYIYEARCPPIGFTHDREHEEMQACMDTWKLKRVDASWDDHLEWKS
jgi:hypothetical protein